MKTIRLLLLTILMLFSFNNFAVAGIPYVTSTNPSNAATDISINAPISITLSEDVQWSTVYYAPVYRILVYEDATNLPFTAFTYAPQADSNVYTLTPVTSLKYNTTYRVEVSHNIASVSTGERIGLLPANDYKFTFTTAASTGIAPTVSPSYPAAGATNIPLGSTITAQFSKPMDSTTIDAARFTVDNGVTGTVTYDNASNSVTLAPSVPLAWNTTYTVTVASGPGGVLSADGLQLDSVTLPNSWSFTTAPPDTSPPTVASSNPAIGATSIPIASSVTVVFSEAMDPSTITSSNIYISGVPGTVTYDAGSYTATFTPTTSLSNATNYTVYVTTGVKDLSGNALQAARVWVFTTMQSTAQPSLNNYCQVPVFVSGSGVKPNVLLLLDNSGSMSDFAYKTPGKGGGAGASADSSYAPATDYYGYFDSNLMYSFNSAGKYFYSDSAKSLDKTNFWSGNFLNWLTMRRVDVVRKVLVGGKTTPRSANTANYLTPFEDTDRDYYKAYNGVWYRVDNGPDIRICTSSACNAYSATSFTNFKIYVGNQPPQDGLVLTYSDRIRFGVEVFNSSGTKYEYGVNNEKDGGNVNVYIGATGTNLITQIEGADPSSWTPLAESFYESIRYFQGVTGAFTNTNYSAHDPIEYSCQKNFVLVLTDGESTMDQNMPGSYWTRSGKVTDSYGFNIKTWMDAIGANEGTASLYSTDANGSYGTYYLAGAAYYAHNTDLRSSTVGNNAISLNQNLTTYAVFAFDDSNVGRKLLKLTSKYGGFEDKNGNGKPDLAIEWDKDGDSIPDTYYEANQGDKLKAALTKAFEDMLNRVSSGTAASILNNSEGSGASLLQAVFYPRKSFDSNTEATWVGEMQNLWYYLDPYLQLSTVRVDTIADNKLNLLNDYIAQFYYDSENQQTRVNLLQDVNGNGSETILKGTYDSDDATHVKSLWRAGRQLWARNLATDDRRIYTRTGVSSLDTVLNSSSESTALSHFTSAALQDSAVVQTYLQAANSTEANKIISFIRGTDQSGYRSRTVTIAGSSGVWRLGDIVSSTPKIQGNVRLNNYNQKPTTGYSDSSYDQFVLSNDYTNRGMAYVGANDGMLHAFRMGVLKELTDPCRNMEADSTILDCMADKSKINDYTVIPGGGTDQGQNANIRANASDKLGREEWAFIPRNVLPYLKYLGDTSYSHLYYVDGTPTIVDVATHIPTTYDTANFPTCSSTNYWECPKQTVYKTVSTVQTKNLDLDNTSWRTILIGSTGLGGASRNIGGAGKCAGGGTDCVFTPIDGLGYSTYFALDITQPTEPKFLWEFAGDPTAGATAAAKGGNLGFATSGPVIMRVGETSKNGKWFAVFASGPTGPIDTTNHQFLGRSDQNLKLFVVDIATGTLARTIDTGVTNAFSGSIYNASIDNDKASSNKPGFYQDDAAYIGYIQRTDSTHWTNGGVIRLITKESLDPADWVTSSVISGIGPVTTSITKLQDRTNSRMWLYFGTGRYYYKNSTEIDDADSTRRLYGLQEPCYSAITQKIDPSCTSSRALADLDDQTLAPSATIDSTKKGWYITLDSSALNDGFKSERVITDPVASASGVVFYTTFRPTSDVCGYGGSSYIWAVNYASGAAPAANVMKGKIMVQVSTGAFAEVSMATGFTAKEGRRSGAIQGVPPKAQGLSLLTNPKPIRKILHIQEK